MSTLYNGAASLGKFEGNLKLYIAGVVSIVLVILAIYMFATNNSNLVNATGKVTAITCPPSSSDNENCNIRINYTVNDTVYNGNINTLEGNYKVGSNIDISYDSTKPTNITLQQKNKITLSIISLVCACLLFGIAYLNYYLTSHSSFFAAVEGAKSIL